jgi:Fic family protein
MIDLSSLLEKIDSLRAELDSLKPLKQVDEERLWKKFRLEWNFNSNHIEGNTLTYGQTELLLIFDKTTGDHDMREYEEMKAHDVAIKLIQEYARDF